MPAAGLISSRWIGSTMWMQKFTSIGRRKKRCRNGKPRHEPECRHETENTGRTLRPAVGDGSLQEFVPRSVLTSPARNPGREPFLVGRDVHPATEINGVLKCV